MIALLVGTRPELIKIAPVLRALKLRKVPHVLIHSNQHYSEELDAQIIRDLQITKPEINLHVGSGTHAVQTGKILEGVETTCLRINPKFIIVHGDTNTTLAGALAAKKLHFPVGHIEAGLRSGDKNMPEEINRIVADHCSTYLFTPTENSSKNLLNENIKQKNIYMVGNTIVDAIQQNLKIAQKKSDIIKKLNLQEKNYILVTTHRAENVDNKNRLKRIFKGLGMLQKKFSIPVIIPLHPRTLSRIKEFKISIPKTLKIIEPLGYMDFLVLESKTRLIATDSGGIQEEACILHVPCITMRDTTERPETIAVGGNVLVGWDEDKILKYGIKMSKIDKVWPNPFGNGNSSELIIENLSK